MRIAIATDAWAPQVNGVVRTLSMTINCLLELGHDIELITPDQFLTVPMPGYREIRLAVAPRFGARRALHAFQPEVVHIATEGPIGWSARRWCLSHKIPFTTAFHTRFPDYASVRTGISPDYFWPVMRRFHRHSRAVLAATPTLMDELAEQGLPHTQLWSRGVDARLFSGNCDQLPAFAALPRPIMLNVGRVAKEKNLEAFLRCRTRGSKVIVGDGPSLAEMKARFPDVHFLGAMHGKELASAYASADVFVFPSMTDTFGLVLVEALASGLPVAAFPIAGPLDIVGFDGRGPYSELGMPVGALRDNLDDAITMALGVNRKAAVRYGATFSWERSTGQFLASLETAVATPLARKLKPAL